MLELSSNTIKVLGIFGRLTKEQEALFDNLENSYSQKPDESEGYDIFRHLTLTFIPNATIGDVRNQLDLLKELKQFLPLKVNVKKPFVKDEESMPGAEHVALEFELDETEKIVEFINERVGDQAVATWYTKVVWFVPKENQQAVMDSLADFKEMVFDDFYLVSNKQSDDNTIYTTNQFTT
jgi:hypothetical protein